MEIDDRQTDKNALVSQMNLSSLDINWCGEGGAEVIRIYYDWYVLFKIPRYEGNAQYINTYHIKDIDKLLDEVYSWT